MHLGMATSSAIPALDADNEQHLIYNDLVSEQSFGSIPAYLHVKHRQCHFACCIQ